VISLALEIHRVQHFGLVRGAPISLPIMIALKDVCEAVVWRVASDTRIATTNVSGMGKPFCSYS
jgi:hypothetical protein